MSDTKKHPYDDGLMTVSEAAAFLRLSRSTIYEMIYRSEIPSYRIGRARRIPHQGLVEFVRNLADRE